MSESGRRDDDDGDGDGGFGVGARIRFSFFSPFLGRSRLGGRPMMYSTDVVHGHVVRRRVRVAVQLFAHRGLVCSSSSRRGRCRHQRAPRPEERRRGRHRAGPLFDPARASGSGSLLGGRNGGGSKQGALSPQNPPHASSSFFGVKCCQGWRMDATKERRVMIMKSGACVGALSAFV